MQLKDRIVKLLNLHYGGMYCNVRELSNGFEIHYGQMYEPPELSFKTLLKLARLFGTEKIDVDNYSQCGCETCDYGSDYGHDIQIYDPTLNVKEMQELVGQDLGDDAVYDETEDEDLGDEYL